MKPITDTQDILLDINDINETMMETAATIDPEGLPLEGSVGIQTLEESADESLEEPSDELPDQAGQKVPEMPAENEQTIAEQLVSAGNEEADLEQRVASDIDKRSEE
jgi:hypothetical protein